MVQMELDRGADVMFQPAKALSAAELWIATLGLVRGTGPEAASVLPGLNDRFL